MTKKADFPSVLFVVIARIASELLHLRERIEALLHYLRGIRIPSKLERGTETVSFDSPIPH